MLDFVPQQNEVIARSLLSQMTGGLVKVQAGRPLLGLAKTPVSLPAIGGRPPIELWFFTSVRHSALTMIHSKIQAQHVQELDFFVFENPAELSFRLGFLNLEFPLCSALDPARSSDSKKAGANVTEVE